MNKTLIKISIIPAILASVLVMTNVVIASETSGTFSTSRTSTLGGSIYSDSLSGTVVVSPVANPEAGTYTSAQSVTLSASGASSIWYTTDGSTPTCIVGTAYSGAINVDSSKTINAVSCYSGGASSTVASFAYVINIPSTPPGGGSSGGSSSGGSSSWAGGSGGLVFTNFIPVIPTGTTPGSDESNNFVPPSNEGGNGGNLLAGNGQDLSTASNTPELSSQATTTNGQAAAVAEAGIPSWIWIIIIIIVLGILYWWFFVYRRRDEDEK